MKLPLQAFEDKIADLENRLAHSRRDALAETSRAHALAELLDRVLGECEDIENLARRIELAKDKRNRGGILLPYDFPFLFKHKIDRFKP